MVGSTCPIFRGFILSRCREGEEGSYSAERGDVQRTAKGQLRDEKASGLKPLMNGRAHGFNRRMVEETDVEEQMSNYGKLALPFSVEGMFKYEKLLFRIAIEQAFHI